LDITAYILTKAQMINGLTVEELDDHVVPLRHGNKIIGRYNRDSVLITELRQDANVYLAGIEYAKNKGD
jgi:hypothetical protein